MRRGGFIVLWLLSAGMICHAVPIIPITWENGGDTHGWDAQYATATVSAPSTGGTPDNAGFLEIRFDMPAEFSVPLNDVVGTTDSNLTGNYQNRDLYVRFSYRGNPGSMQSLYMESTAGGGSTWVRDFSSVSTNWQTIAIAFRDPFWIPLVNNYSVSLDEALSSVSLIGYAIQTPAADPGSVIVYGLDNFEFQVPEPSSMVLIGAALFCTAVVFGRRRRAPVASDSTPFSAA